MGRRGGGGRSRSRSSGGGGGFFGRSKPKTKTKSAPRSKAAPPPARAPAAAPAPAQGGGGGGMLGGIGSMIMQGMAFGAGSSIAHRAIDGVAGPRTVQHEHVGAPAEAAAAPAAQQGAGAAPAVENACMSQTQQFAQCIQENNGNVGACSFYFDLLSQCQTDFAASH